jgi:hypothetical protein
LQIGHFISSLLLGPADSKVDDEDDDAAAVLFSKEGEFFKRPRLVVMKYVCK